MNNVRDGGCLCGKIRYRADGPVRWSGHCHCRLCQRASGAPLVTWFTVDAGDFAFTAGSPQRYRSSEKGERTFCGDCGTPLTFRHDDSAQDVDITAASLDDPDNVAPTVNVHTVSRRRFLHGFDETLPSYRDGSES